MRPLSPIPRIDRVHEAALLRLSPPAAETFPVQNVFSEKRHTSHIRPPVSIGSSNCFARLPSGPAFRDHHCSKRRDDLPTVRDRERVPSPEYVLGAGFR
jgi:hypothetical protein